MAPKHLDEEALIRASYGVPDSGEAAHLTACAECTAAMAAFEARRFAAGRAGDAVEQLPAAFWQRQCQAILAAAHRPAAPPLRPATAALGLAMLLLLAVLVVGRSTRVPQKVLAPSGQAYPFRAEDEQLLREIDSLVNRVEPRALAPAALLLPDQSHEVQQQ